MSLRYPNKYDCQKCSKKQEKARRVKQMNKLKEKNNV